MATNIYVKPEWINLINSFPTDTSTLTIITECMNQFGTDNDSITFSEWGQIVRHQVENKSQLISQVKFASPDCLDYSKSHDTYRQDLCHSILDYLKHYPNSKAIEIASHLGVSRSKINSELDRMRNEGFCIMNDLYRWELSDLASSKIDNVLCEERAIYKKNSKNNIENIIHSICLDKYRELFCNLTVSNRSGKKAPHKYILLISVFQLIGRGVITSNKFNSSYDIEKEFLANWKLYIPQDTPFKSNYATPFWHMMSEPFWNLYDKDGNLINNQWQRSVISVNKQRREITAELSNELFEIIKNEEYRETLISHLITCLKIGL